MAGTKHPVAGLKVLYQRAGLHNLRAAFMPQDQVVPVADCALPDRMHVRRADCRRKRTADRIQRPAYRTGLFHPANLADPQHCKSLHAYPRFPILSRDSM